MAATIFDTIEPDSWEPFWSDNDDWMAEDYTCICGLYVHPTRINKDAIHIDDCEYAILYPVEKECGS